MIKKIVKRITSFMLVVLSVLSISGCGGFKGEGDFTRSEEIAVEQRLHKNIERSYKAESKKNLQLIGEPVTDGEKNFFSFKLGQVDNVPVYWNNAFKHNGFETHVYEWKTEYSAEEAYKRTQSKIVENTISTTSSIEISSKVGTSISASYSGVNATASVEAASVVKDSLELSVGYTTSEEFSETVSNIVSETKTRTVTIGPNAPEGAYRYTIYASVEVYVTLICDIKKQTIQYAYTSVILADTYMDGFAYSADNVFDVSAETYMPIDVEQLNAMNLSFFKENLPNKTKGYVFANTILLKSQPNKKVTDQGLYGLEQTHLVDFLNLNSFEEFLTDEYIFTFSGYFKSQDGSKSISDDKREVHLYAKYNTYVSDTYNMGPTMVKEDYGHILEENWYGNDEHTFEWVLSGGQCNVEMYLYYDASGTGNDDWYLKAIKVELTITKK